MRSLMQNLKIAFGILCLGYLLTAALPGCQAHTYHCSAATIYSAWLGRLLFVIDGLLFGAAFACMQIRKPVCWKLIPTILAAYWLTYVIPPFVFPSSIQYSWLPKLAVIFVTITIIPIFIIWWRNKKSYFNISLG